MESGQGLLQRPGTVGHVLGQARHFARILQSGAAQLAQDLSIALHISHQAYLLLGSVVDMKPYRRIVTR